jgi:hypothetical protein
MNKKQIRDRLLNKFNKKNPSPLQLTRNVDDGSLIIPTITNFIAAHPAFSRKLFDCHGSVPHLGNRLGRGEVLFYFIFDDVELGGSSSSIDVYKVVNEVKQPFLEIKCATPEGERYLNFFMGMDEVPSSLKFFYRILKMFEKNDRLGKMLLPTNFAHISKTKLEELKTVSPQLYKKAEEAYFADLINGPIGRKVFLIFDQITMLPIYHGLMVREQLKIERVSGGLTRLSFKP